MTEQLNREECLQVLGAMAVQTGRLPRKSDFSEYEAARIKAFFGPWPRALEAAGLLPSKTGDKEAKKQEKRINAKHKEILSKKSRN